MLANRLKTNSFVRFNARGSVLLLMPAIVLLVACARNKYSTDADREAYCLIDSRKSDPLWETPSQRIEPVSVSRMHVPGDRDCGPKPEDDAAANQYMRFPKCIDNTHYYDNIATRLGTENIAWLDSLPREPDGSVTLSKDLALQLALLHSRDYQTNFENVYLDALTLSNNRFEFDCQWFWGLGSSFLASGDDLGGDRLFNVGNGLGFSRNLAGGGQFATNLANGLFWNFGSGGIDTGSAALVSTFTQPLLRGAFRHVRLEDLTQAERNLLYSVRDFARFRRSFYRDVVTDYLSLLTQVQALRNARTNVQNLAKSLNEHQLLVSLGMVSEIQASQVFLQYQAARARVLASEQNLIASMDQFKLSLGLPAWVPFELEEETLSPFEFVSADLQQLQEEVQTTFDELVQYLPPKVASKKYLQETYSHFVDMHDRLANIMPEVQDELAQWKSRLSSTSSSSMSDPEKLDLEQQRLLVADIESSLADLQDLIDDRSTLHKRVAEILDAYQSNPHDANALAIELPAPGDTEPTTPEADTDSPLPEPPAVQAWDSLQTAIGQDLREQIADLYVAQTQIRLFLIDIEPFQFDQNAAVTYAHFNRLDLKNAKAQVMDTFRRVEVAADQLESDLSLTGSMALGSDSGKNNAFSFDSANNTYRVGLQFDGPLNRLNERNNYRASQIVYQREFRNYLASKDIVTNEVRSIIRRMELSRLNFQIARQQLVAATSQVDQAQIDIRRNMEAGSNLTLFLLEALQGVLDAKNGLIGNWIAYRQLKMELFVALEMLYLDENGNWLNEEEGLREIAEFRMIDPEYFPPEWTAVQDSSGGEMPSIEEAEEIELSDFPNDASAMQQPADIETNY